MASFRLRRSLPCWAFVWGLAGCSLPFGPELKQRLLAEVGETLQDRAYALQVDWGRWPDHVATVQVEIDAARDEREFTRAANLALAGFGISHLALLGPRRAQQRADGDSVGLGVLTVPVEGGRLVTDVVAGGPAAVAGLQRGDVVLAVDREASGSGPLPRSTIGATMILEWRRGDETSTGRAILATHRRASRDALSWIDGEHACIRINSFSRTLYDRDLVDEMFEKAAGAVGLVLDLRSNLGGDSRNARHLLGLLLRDGTAIQTVVYREGLDRFLHQNPERYPSRAELGHRFGEKEYTFRAPESDRFAGPVVVLVDAWSGSAAEVAAAALQDAKRVVVMGTRTRRQVRVSDHIPLRAGYLLQCPVGEVLRPSGGRLEDVGVTPDIDLSATEASTDSIVMPRAVGVLRTVGQRSP